MTGRRRKNLTPRPGPAPALNNLRPTRPPAETPFTRRCVPPPSSSSLHPGTPRSARSLFYASRGYRTTDGTSLSLCMRSGTDRDRR